MPASGKTDFLVTLGRPDEYRRAKRLLDQGKHPTFVGRDTVTRQARQGGLLFARADDRDVAVAVVNVRRQVLLVMNVHPDWRGTGAGSWFLEFVRPNWVRAVESAVPWFEQRGYTPIGALKHGRALNTQVMVRSGLMELAGRVSKCLGDRCRCTEQA